MMLILTQRPSWLFFLQPRKLFSAKKKQKENKKKRKEKFPQIHILKA